MKTRYEDRLARALRKVGPFVAIGDPTERLPLLGAVRMYAADEDWQARVSDLIGRAGVVLLHAGGGDGFTWEVRHVVEHGVPERVILSLPLDARRSAALAPGTLRSLPAPVRRRLPAAAAGGDRTLPIRLFRRGLDGAAARRARRAAPRR